jgi:hypothetical protein
LTIPACEVILTAALSERPLTITLFRVRFEAKQIEQTEERRIGLWRDDNVISIDAYLARTDVRHLTAKARKSPKQ